MTAFTVRTATHYGVDRIATAVTAQALYENLKAVLEKDATAIAAGWVLANSYVEEVMLAAASVSQAKLKTGLNSISINGTNGGALATLSGGQYCFAPTGNLAAGSGSDNFWAVVGPAHHRAGAAVSTAFVTGTEAELVNTTFGGASGLGSLTLLQYRYALDDPSTIDVRYVNASPPYNLGSGDVPVFIFARVSSLGVIREVWAAQDPPWAHNGPTDIRPQWHDRQGRGWRRERVITDQDRLDLRDPLKREAAIERIVAAATVDIEVTQELKQRDMPLIPRPFMGDLGGDTVVMLPVNSMLDKLAILHECSGVEGPGMLMLRDYLRLDNEPLNVVTPPGVVAVDAEWKLT